MPKKPTKKPPDISLLSHNFYDNLKALRLFVNNFDPIAKEHDEYIITGFYDILGIKENDIQDYINKDQPIELNTEKLKDLRTFFRVYPSLRPHSISILYNSSLVLLVCYFDNLCADLFKFRYNKIPKSLTGKELKIHLDELKTCGTIKEAVELLIDMKVDELLKPNLRERKSIIQNELNICICEDIINWDILYEAIARRNIIVHNNNIINKRYLKIINDLSNYRKPKTVKEGNKIKVDQKYFNDIYINIYIAGTILIQNCWRKWEKTYLEPADKLLIDKIYDWLLEENWAVSEELAAYARTIEPSDEYNKLIFDVNYCQSLKWQNKDNALNKELKKFDTSGLATVFVLTVAALKSDIDTFYKNLDKAIADASIKEDDLYEWPIFREFREDANYKRNVERALKAKKIPTKKKTTRKNTTTKNKDGKKNRMK